MNLCDIEKWAQQENSDLSVSFCSWKSILTYGLIPRLQDGRPGAWGPQESFFVGKVDTLYVFWAECCWIKASCQRLARRPMSRTSEREEWQGLSLVQRQHREWKEVWDAWSREARLRSAAVQSEVRNRAEWGTRRYGSQTWAVGSVGQLHGTPVILRARGTFEGQALPLWACGVWLQVQSSDSHFYRYSETSF